MATVDINLMTDEWILDPVGSYHRLRSEPPVAYSEPMKCWLVTSFDACQAILTDATHFSNTIFASEARAPWMEGATTLLGSDDPDHARLRSIVQPFFLNRSISKLEDRVVAAVEEILDSPEAVAAMDSGEPVDTALDFAADLPITVVAEILGVPKADRRTFRHWAETMMLGSTGPELTPPEVYEAAMNAGRSMADYLRSEIERHRANRHDDLICVLVEANDEKLLSDAELLAMCVLLLEGGGETTTAGISSLLVLLASHPDQRERIIQDPSLAKPAFEEALRFDGVARFHFRIVRENVEIGGVTMAAGEIVGLLLGAANRDPAHFTGPDPDRFDIDRPAKPHLAFGWGSHFCIGAHLARLEARTAVNAWLARWPDYQVVEVKRGPTYPTPTFERLKVTGGPRS